VSGVYLHLTSAHTMAYFNMQLMTISAVVKCNLQL